MLRERISKIFNNKTLYLVISIVAAITLWVYVTNIDNQNTETTILGINVNFTGKEELAAKGLAIDDSYNYTVSLSVLGKRDEVMKLKNSNITVNADVSDISSSGSFDKLYSVLLPPNVNPNEVYILKKTPDFVQVRINKFISKTVAVKGEFSGTLADGFEAKPLEYSTDSVIIDGPESVVSRISCAWVKLSQNGVNKTIKKKINILLLDSSGAEVPINRLNVSTMTIEVTLPVRMVKSVPLAIKLNPGGGATETNIKYSIEPKTIKLSGDPDTVGNIKSITLKEYNLSDIISDFSETCDIAVPEGVVNESGISKANVAISVTGLTTKVLKVSNIKITNVYSGHKATLLTKDIDVTLRGDKSVLDAVTADNITITIDLADLGQSIGKYTVPAKVTFNETVKAGAIGNYSAVIVLDAT